MQWKRCGFGIYSNPRLIPDLNRNAEPAEPPQSCG